MSKIKNKVSIGDIFTRWTVIGEAFSIKNVRHVECKCSCNKLTIKNISISNLIMHKSKSCGCIRDETAVQTFTKNKFSITHNLSKHPLYHHWENMKSRCYYKKSPKYHNYGGKGIRVCKQWKNDFKQFYDWSINNGWKKGLSIDRINNSKGYLPSNCKWSTTQEQNNNTSQNVWVCAFGESKNMKQWSKDNRCKVGYDTLRHRISKQWQPEEAITKPPLRKKS